MCTAEKRIKFATKLIQHYPPHLTLGMLLHYLGKLKIQILCRYSADMEESTNKLHLCTDFNSSTRTTLYAECIYVLTEEQNIKHAKAQLQYFLFAARSAAAWPLVNSACVPQLFQQLINTTLCCPTFLWQFVCQPLCCVPLQIQTLSISCFRRWIPCWLLTNAAVTCADEFSMPQTDRKSKQTKEQWHQYGERLAILNIKNIKMWGQITKRRLKNAICLRFLPHLQKISIFNFPR